MSNNLKLALKLHPTQLAALTEVLTQSGCARKSFHVEYLMEGMEEVIERVDMTQQGINDVIMSDLKGASDISERHGVYSVTSEFDGIGFVVGFVMVVADSSCTNIMRAYSLFYSSYPLKH